MNVVAVLSMIHESADRNSATRQFRKESVLRWTLSRVRQVENLAGICVICWDDQVDSVTPAAAAVDAEILCKSPRMMPATVEAVSAARRWADGWRGGPLQTCDCDEGIHAPYVLEILERFHADAALLVNPGAAMVDPRILRDVVARGNDRAAIDLAFTAAAPGLGGVLMRETLLRRLAGTQIHAGRLMHYLPDQPTRDPLAGEGCVDVPTRVARTLRRFMLDSDRQINSISLATVPLNGQLVRSSAAEIVDRLESNRLLDAMPREVRIDLTTRRAARPIYLRAFESPAPGESTGERPSLNPSELRSIFDQLARADDLRLTFAGTGDPLLHPQFIQTLHAAREAGINAISVETDLLDVSPDCLVQLVDATPDIISIHLPAFTRETYATVMGRDGWAVALACTLTSAHTPASTKCERRISGLLACAVLTVPRQTWHSAHSSWRWR